MAAPYVSEGTSGSGAGALVLDVDTYVRQLAEVSSRTGGRTDPATQATAWAEAHRVSAWGLRAAVSAARDQGLSWRELAELLDVPAATLHRQYRSGQALTMPVATGPEPPAALPDLDDTFTAPAPAPAVPAGVPTSLDLFVGRDRALADAPGLLSSGRMLTLAGPGGVGKTRLAIELANRIRGSYRGGVLWAELAPVAPVPAAARQGASAEIEAAIVAAAGATAQGRKIDDLLAAACAAGPVLLVLDNCEHLVDDAARTASSLLSAHPHLRVLATSREPLRIAGETVLPVRPLSAESAGPRGGPPPAVRLFIDRAQATAADFDADEHAGAIAELCRELDGLPLAIELAARQISALPPAMLLSRLAERLDLLTGGPRNAPHRQQSLRAAIEWSYQLLDSTEQAVFRRLTVLPGGFDQHTAAAVTASLGLSRAALWGLLATLASKSLTAPDQRVPGRYRILESLRAYGLEQLDAEHERSTTDDELLAWYADLAAQMYRTFATRDALLASCVVERDNLQYAVGIAEAAADPRWPAMANLLAAVWNWGGELPRAKAILTHLVASPHLSPADRTETLRRLSLTVGAGGDGPLSLRYGEECLALARSHGDTSRMAEAVNVMSDAYSLMGDFAASVALIQEHLPLIRTIANPDHLCLTLDNLAWCLLAAGQADAAQAPIDEALSLAAHNVMTLTTACVIRVVRGDHDAATAHARQALNSANPGHKQLLDCCDVLAIVAAERGDPERALRLFAATTSIRAGDGLKGDPWWAKRVRDAAATARASVTPAAALGTAEDGAALTVEETIAYALHDTLPRPVSGQGSPLTSREQNVAELVAQGHTNAQIAARLFISNRTVATHLTHIRAKLGVPSRVHIAAWVNNQKTG